MHIKTLTIPLAILAGIAVPGLAAAHNATATGTCQGGVQWSATAYDAQVVNSITVTIDGTVKYSDPDFKTSDTGTIATDKTVPHSWRVVVNAPGTQFDKDVTGSYAACVTVPTTTVAPTTTTVAPTTTTVPATTTTVPATTVPETHPPTTPAPEFPDPTTTVVAVDTPPVPCQYNPNIPADSPACVSPTTTAVASDVVTVEPALPRTGLDGTIVVVAALLVIGGVVLVLRGRRV